MYLRVPPAKRNFRRGVVPVVTFIHPPITPRSHRNRPPVPDRNLITRGSVSAPKDSESRPATPSRPVRGRPPRPVRVIAPAAPRRAPRAKNPAS